jgi:NADH-quinone oxidoreductase subunit K
MSIEIMLNAVNLLFVAFSTYHPRCTRTNFRLFSMAVAAAEVACRFSHSGFYIFRNLGSIDINNLKNLKDKFQWIQV